MITHMHWLWPGLVILLFLPDRSLQETTVSTDIVQYMTPQCKADWERANRERYTEDWAMRMFDARGQVESGTLDHNYVYEGDYQECDRISETNHNISHPIHGLYCVHYNYAELFKLKYKTIHWGGVCYEISRKMITHMHWLWPGLVILLFLPDRSLQETTVSTDIVQYMTPQCKADWERANRERYTEDWAMRMFDARGQVESGTLDHNYVYEGDYQECDRISETNHNISHPIHGLYCVHYNYAEHPYYTRGVGVCVPQTCNERDAELILQSDNPLESLPQDVLNRTGIAFTFCVRNRPWSVGAIITVIILLLTGLLIIVSSVMDMKLQKRQKKEKNPKRNEEEGLDVDNGNVTEMSPITMEDNVSQNIEEEISENPAGPECVLTKRTLQNEEENENLNYSNNTATYAAHNKPGKLLGVLLSFSLYTNVPRMLSTEHAPGSYECIHGVRFLSFACIVLHHTYELGITIAATPAISNRRQQYVMYRSVPNVASAAGEMYNSVEAFFVMSAMLVTISFMKSMKKADGKASVKQVLLFYVHRYVRLTPVYAICILIWTYLYYHFGKGPFFLPIWDEVESCKRYMWAHLLYVHTLMPHYQLCLFWSWYLAIDFQLYIMAPFFIILLYKFKKGGKVALALGYTGSLLANFILYIFVIYYGLDYFTTIYLRPWTRATSYFIGILLGYVTFRTNRKLQIRKALVIVGWVACVLFLFFGVYLTAAIHRTKPLQTSVVALAVAWVILACLNGYGGFINRFLSWRIWVPLARLAYVGYLVHPIFIYILMYGTPRQIYLYNYLIVYFFIGNMVLTLAASFVLSAMYEVPMMAIGRLLLPSK